MAAGTGGKLDHETLFYGLDAIERIAPRDPIEEMLMAQMLFAHARVTRLSDLANRQSSLEGLRTVNEYADRASNTFRRLALALAEYRNPARVGPGDSFTVVHQSNIAGQQVICPPGEIPKNATNELGCQHARHSENPQTLPTHSPGTGIPALAHSESEALGAIHWAKDEPREGSLPHEPPQARGAKRKGPRRASPVNNRAAIPEIRPE